MKKGNQNIQYKTHRVLLRCEGLRRSVTELYDEVREEFGNSGRVDNFFIAMINLREAARNLHLAEENLGNETAEHRAYK
jgi:hypothetical protein